MDDQLKSLSSVPLSKTTLEEIELRVAKLIEKGRLDYKTSRATIWVPLADAILSRSSTVGEKSFLLSTIDEAITNPRNYDASNLLAECLRRGTTTGMSLFDMPRYYAATILYDPFAKVPAPHYNDLIRLFLDLNIIESVTHGSKKENPFTSVEKEEIKLTIPQTVPGLGGLIASPRWSTCGMDGVKAFIEWATKSTTTTTTSANVGGTSALSEWWKVEEDNADAFTKLASELKIRIGVVDLRCNLLSPKCLIKYKFSVVQTAMAKRLNILTPSSIEELYPFIHPPPGEMPKVTRPHTTYGKTGKMIVLLDYGYGVDRYLPLLVYSGEALLPADVSLKSLWKLSLPTTTEDLGIIGSLQQSTFLLRTLHPSRYLEPDPPVQRIVKVEGESDEKEKEDEKYMTAAAELIDDFRAGLTDKMSAIYKGYFLQKIRVAISYDLSDGIKPFSPTSMSASLMYRAQIMMNRFRVSKED
jgi:hypothetical protein